MLDRNAKFEELGRIEIGLNKSLVVSRRSDGFFSVAQVIHAATDTQDNMSVFMKNAITVKSVGLVNMRDLFVKIVDELALELTGETSAQTDPQ